MQSFRRILVYASLEDEAFLALEQGAALARAHGAALTLLRVLPERESLVGRLRRREEADRLQRALAEGQEALLQARVAPLLEEGLDVRVELRWGSPWLEVIRTVLRDDNDLVLKTAEGAARGQGLFFGSTAMHLIRKCPCPVWILGDDASRGPRRVLAAIDPDADGERSTVTEGILNLAVTAAGEDAELHVASVWRASGETLLQKRIPREELEAYVRAEREAAKERLEKTLSKAPGRIAPERVHLAKGDPGRVLPELVASGGFGLVVVGSVGRAGVAGLLIGETAETLVRSVRSSVLVVKPPGFVSPVAPLAEA